MNSSEKVTININVVDLGNIDLLVNEGFYSNRTDFIKTAIRNQLNNYAKDLQKVIIKKNFSVGIVKLGKKELQECITKKEKLDIKVVGMLIISDDVTYELAIKSINSINVSGVLRCNSKIKEYFKTLL